MMTKQNYISTELTHFVGKELPGGNTDEVRERQYALLLRILQAGCLKSKTGGSSSFLCDPFAKLSTNLLVRLNVVCFCDIPLAGLAIHMSKYSPFGVAFAKSFLVDHGANPVFYISNDSKARSRSLRSDKATSHLELRAEYFDRQFAEFYDCMRAVKRLLYTSPNRPPETDALLKRMDSIESFLSSLFGYFKCFDSGRTEDDQENFYMEREWRIWGRVHFKMDDVQRIILPRTFLGRLKTDLPSFVGEEEAVADEITSIKAAVVRIGKG